MLNKCQFIGNVGKDPEIRSTQDDREIASLSLAVSERWKDKATGERKEVTEWIRVVVFNEGLVRVIKSYVKKGSKIYIEGQMKTRKWTDKDGQDKYSTEVVLQNYGGQLILLDGAPKADGAVAQGDIVSNSDYLSEHSVAKADGYAPQPPVDEIPFAWAALLAPFGALLLMSGVA